MRKSTYLILIAIILASCASEEHVYDPEDNAIRVFRINVTTISGVSSESINSISAYMFANDVLESVHEDLPINDNNITLNILSGKNKKLFFLANALIKREHLVTGETSLNDLKMMTTGHLTSLASKTDFMSCLHELDNDIKETNLLRSTARLDIDTSIDAFIEVNNITIENTPTDTYILRQIDEKAPGQTEKISHTFDIPLSGYKEEILRLFESSSPLTVTLKVQYAGIPIELHNVIPKLKRNHKYTLRVNKIGTVLDSEVIVSNWESGDIIEGFPDISLPIDIDMQATEIPSEGVFVNREKRRVVFNKEGGEMILAFNSPYSLDMMVENPSNRLSVEKVSPQKYRIRVNAQNRGDDIYTVRLKVKPDISAFYFDYVDVVVDTYPAHTVQMGGLEWMSFNSFGPSMKNQVFPPDNLIISYYNSHWSTSLGQYYQWGRVEGSTPWTTTVDTPLNGEYLIWNKAGTVPCPMGYRLPTLDEFKKLIPPGSKTSGGWNTDEGWLGVSLTNPSSININGASVTPRSLQLNVRTISSNKTLIFPLSGYKAAGQHDENPGLGNRMAYWVADRSIYGTAVTRLELISTSGVLTYNTSSNINGYAAVRCVKDNNFNLK